MDSAEKNLNQSPDQGFLLQAVSSQGQLLGKHDSLLNALLENQQASAAQISHLSSLLENLTTSLSQSAAGATAAPPPPAPSLLDLPTPGPQLRESHVPDPEHYSGDMGKCGAFLLQCSLVFSQKPVTFAADSAKIAFVMGLLQGKALAWASAIWQNNPAKRQSYALFEAELKKVFDHPVQGKEAARRMLALKQSSKSVAEYSIEFRILAAEAGWNDEALMSVFANGLNDQLKDELAIKDEYSDLDALISAAIRLDNRMRERRRDHSRHQAFSRLSTSSHSRGSSSTPSNLSSVQSSQGTRPHTSDEEPMQLGRTRLTPAERLRRIKSGECIYCGQVGHFLATCPVRPKEGAHQ